MSTAPFGSYAEFYDLLYQDKDYEAEVEYVRDLIERHAPKPRSILEIGCGTGRHALSLAQSQISVLGIDRSEDMLEIAKQRVLESSPKIRKRLRFAQTDLELLQVQERFDAVISLFHVFSYCASDEAIDGFFQAAHRHLPRGGSLFFDCWYGPAVVADPPTQRVKEVQNERYRISREANPSFGEQDALVNITYKLTVQDKRTGESSHIEENHLMRHFTTSEVEDKLAEKGFALSLAKKWMSDEEPDETDWSACFLAIKK